MTQPLTDAINALTRYANETTGASDTTLSDAVETLVEGYGQGGGGSVSQDAEGYIVLPVDGGGDSGMQILSEGTFIGSGNNLEVFEIGNKMARTDFIIKISAKETFPYDANYKFAIMYLYLFKEDGYFDLSSNGQKSPIADRSFTVDNDGTLTTVADGGYRFYCGFVRNGSWSNGSLSDFNIIKSDTGYSIRLRHGNPSYKFPSIEYEYSVTYFGTDAETDIIEVTT